MSREAFEHWYSDEGKSPAAVRRNASGDGYHLAGTGFAWEVWQAAIAQHPTAPQGIYAPTDERIDALWRAACERHDLTQDMVRAFARAVLAEAPQANAVCEPFGYFRALPFGWTDCAETDEGAVALYEHPAPAPYRADARNGQADALDAAQQPGNAQPSATAAG